ncbi:hypothetical protein R1sor_010164 [Riccia sorocarpa]|uniref:Reverse transcriptase domain-containing protein n=1 Tax=Riccia sorocarpa TaxID=122646 RepID=A0ABD3HXB4_9MARC
MKNPEVLQKIRREWENHPVWARDARKKWYLALGRVRKILKECRDKQNQEVPEAAEIRRRLEEARLAVQDCPSTDNRKEFEIALVATYESLTEIRIGTGELVTDEDAISKLVEETYTELYTADLDTVQAETGRREALQLIDKKLTVEQNTKLGASPSEECIEEIRRSVPKDKAPGIDGVTAEVLVAGWSFMKNDCIAMEEKTGRIKGVNYGGETTLLHQIYADDTEINITMDETQFDQLTSVLQMYKDMSGAKLNLSKSLIMPLKPGRPPSWVYNTGCEVAAGSESFIYLGVSTSSPVSEKEITEGIIKKIRKRLSHWSNRLLSWPARTLLLRKVLAATPLYQLLSVGMDRKGIDAVERLCRQFLWGWADESSPKAAVIAWERIAQSAKDDG